jgi:hypothetical protein
MREAQVDERLGPSLRPLTVGPDLKMLSNRWAQYCKSSGSYLGSVPPSGHLVDVAVGGAREVDGERVAVAVPRRYGRHLRGQSYVCMIAIFGLFANFRQNNWRSA